jgi:multimeric flavodoxin WrbA
MTKGVLMKVLAINGSPRKNGNTEFLINTVFEELHKEGIETDLVQLGGNSVRGCLACGRCFENKNGRCVIETDMINKVIEKMFAADGIIIASPTYFANVTSEIKALIDRAGYVGIANDRAFRRKVGAAVVAVRRAGSTDAFDAINKFFFIQEMIVPGSTYWNLGIGRAEGSVSADEEGINTMHVLGRNMAWLMKKINS